MLIQEDTKKQVDLLSFKSMRLAPTSLFINLLLRSIDYYQVQVINLYACRPTSMPTMSFDRFYELWIQNFQLLLHQLLSIIPNQPKKPEEEDEEGDHHQLSTQLIERVMTHYGDYCRVKTQAAKQDPLFIYNSSWFTSLERSIHWITGWRPTTIFHLIYTEISVRFEARIVDILKGHKTGDLGDLSPCQLSRVSELQCDTVREENEISSELTYWQVSSACDIVSLLNEGEPEIERLVNVLERAEDLRLRTITKVVEILTPQQAIDFLIAAAELQFGVRVWGLDKDKDHRTAGASRMQTIP